jgi:hypothetical protein
MRAPITPLELIGLWLSQTPTLTAAQRMRAAKAFVKQELRRSGFKIAEPMNTSIKRRTPYGRVVTTERGIRCWAQRGDGDVLHGVLCYRPDDPTYFRFVVDGQQMRGNACRGTVMAAIRAGIGGDR